jgi:hypothetical protein
MVDELIAAVELAVAVVGEVASHDLPHVMTRKRRFRGFVAGGLVPSCFCEGFICCPSEEAGNLPQPAGRRNTGQRFNTPMMATRPAADAD